MASQLALLFVRRLEVPVVLTDLDQERVDKGVGYVHAEIDKLLAKGRINQDKANRLKALVTGAVDKGEVFADADFVIEAVFEEMSVKKAVFADVEKAVSPECVLATNTSSLSITEMAADLEHPERVVGFHFFNPVAVMPLLEIVQGERTDDATLATAFATGKALKKTTILVKDSPSFIVNRLLGRFMGEVGRIVDEGTPVPVADGAFAGVAPMPPFVLLVARRPGDRAAQQRDPARRVPRPVLRLPAPGAGWSTARKTSYYGPDGAPRPRGRGAARARRRPGRADARAGAQQVLDGLAEEARLMLDEGVVVAAEDLDLAMITGAGSRSGTAASPCCSTARASRRRSRASGSTDRHLEHLGGVGHDGPASRVLPGGRSHASSACPARRHPHDGRRWWCPPRRPRPPRVRPGCKKAQRRLNDLGCDAGPADGDVGRWTRSARDPLPVPARR